MQTFEGAGILLCRVDADGRCDLVLGERQKTAVDEAADPTPELEFMGGKSEGAETAAETAARELVEEVGGAVLDADWAERALQLASVQPSQKLTALFVVRVSDAEWLRLRERDADLAAWDAAALRNGCRKALKSLQLVSLTDLTEHLARFSTFQVDQPRYAAAKAFRLAAQQLRARRITQTDVTTELSLRAFNVLVLGEHVDAIERFLKR